MELSIRGSKHDAGILSNVFIPMYVQGTGLTTCSGGFIMGSLATSILQRLLCTLASMTSWISTGTRISKTGCDYFVILLLFPHSVDFNLLGHQNSNRRIEL